MPDDGLTPFMNVDMFNSDLLLASHLIGRTATVGPFAARAAGPPFRLANFGI
jgi:hypothetical protein